jgi:hypothetical protein
VNLPIDILGPDTTVKTEKPSYRGIPTELARAPRVRAAGTFVGIFRNKLAAPGELVEFGTRHRGKTDPIKRQGLQFLRRARLSHAWRHALAPRLKQES